MLQVTSKAVCPKGIRLEFIARMNRDFLVASQTMREEKAAAGAG
jgi:hypothetical protein